MRTLWVQLEVELHCGMSSYLCSTLLGILTYFSAQEFGVDIVGEANKTIIHHKAGPRVVCVFSEHDAHATARVEQHYHSLQLSS